MFKLTPKEQKLVILLALLLVLGIVLRFALPAHGEKNTDMDITFNPEHSNGNGDLVPAEEKMIIIHVTGAVDKPGVYILDEGSRVFQAIEKAGGHTDDADLERINLAEPLYDGQPVYVPRKSDTVSPQAEGSSFSAVQGVRVNINRANKSQLESLPGIGAVKAQSILDYREKNGPFHSVDEIVKVTGIGDKTLEGLRDLITIY
ncbi:MAG: helix-hairpin-helix domain-containing protein [Bacillota bacterium]|nr:helix-hairpin-helix domain-containing protein [Bacillota bacterium]